MIFGSGPSGLREFARDAYNLKITLEEARAVIDRFLATYPGVARWQREQEGEDEADKDVCRPGAAESIASPGSPAVSTPGTSPLICLFRAPRRKSRSTRSTRIDARPARSAARQGAARAASAR